MIEIIQMGRTANHDNLIFLQETWIKSILIFIRELTYIKEKSDHIKKKS